MGLQALLKNRPKPVIKHLSPAISHYLLYNEDWYHQVAALSDYAHFALGSFERLAEAVTLIIYLTADLETHQHLTKLRMVAQCIGVVVECLRVLRAHLMTQYGTVKQVMVEFDEIAGNIQQLCNDTQFNVDNILEYQKLTK